MQDVHSLLKRQMKRYAGGAEVISKEWLAFLQAVNESYKEFDDDRALIERSLDISSKELSKANSDMRALFEAIPDLFFRINRDDVVVEYKAGTECDWKLLPQDVVGKQIKEIPIFNVNPEFFYALSSVRKDRAMGNVECSHFVDGVKKYLEARLLPLFEDQVIVMIRDISNRKIAELSLSTSEQNLRRHNQILQSVTKSEALIEGDLGAAFDLITESACAGLNTERASIWYYNEQKTEIVCQNLYESSTRLHTEGTELHADDFPDYFSALEMERTIAADDAVNDPRTREFSESYLKPLGITSMLDASIQVRGKTVGIICNEHVGPGRVWSIEERHFAGAMADAISLALEIRERLRVEKAFDESENKFRIFAESTDSAIFIYRDTFHYVNPAMERITGYSENELLGKQLLDIVHPESLDAALELSELDSSGDGPLRCELQIVTKDGGSRWLFVVAQPSQWQGKLTVLASAFDITDRKAIEDQLRHQALHDVLTGLANRDLFVERLREAFDRADADPKYRFAVMFLDIDRFKVINDSLGHAFGDEFLKVVSRRLKAGLRSNDTVARFGGDEFCILIDGFDSLKNVTDIAQTLQAKLSQPVHLQEHDVVTSASIGIALHAPNYEEGEHMLRDADIAMYRAKAKGKACYEVFDTAMHSRVKGILSLESDLRRAVKNNEFELHYQPIFSIHSKKIVCFEALLRWQHPERGLVSPDEFIPAAEETGLIVPIGKWVLRKGCEQLKTWQRRFESEIPLTLSVNVSGKQLSRGDLIGDIERVLMETGVAADCLKIELTESMIMENREAAGLILSKLREMNIEVYLDDFGTGYSSLSHLLQFPVDVLKIDRSFVDNIDRDTEKQQIVKGVVSLADALDLRVIAEGVETETQLAHLRSTSCDLAQGYYLAMPMCAEDATAFLEKSYASYDVSTLS